SRTLLPRKSKPSLTKGQSWKCTSPTSTAGISLLILTPQRTRKLRKRGAFPTNHRASYVLFLGLKTQSPRENRDAAWQSFTIVHHKLTNSFLRKAGTSTTTDSLRVVMFRRVRTRTITR